MQVVTVIVTLLSFVTLFLHPFPYFASKLSCKFCQSFAHHAGKQYPN